MFLGNKVWPVCRVDNLAAVYTDRSFRNYQQLLNFSMLNCFRIIKYFVFQGFLQEKAIGNMWNSWLCKNYHTRWIRLAGPLS
jgi:hypothetical protein